MAEINLKEYPAILAIVSRKLSRRGSVPVHLTEWEVHGPHKYMPYEVYVGYAKDEHRYLVAIYPRSVYGIDGFSDWWKVTPENKINII